MNTVFVYEHLIGGGLLDQPGPALAELKAEGAAMLQAVTADFARLADTSVVTLRDRRFQDVPLPGVDVISVRSISQAERAFCDQAARADASLVIAPESSGLLAAMASRVVDAGGRLISPGPDTIRVATDKLRCQQLLAASGLPVPESRRLPLDERGQGRLPSTFPYPAVVKPIDGAGGEGILPVSGPATCPLDSATEWMIESWSAGMAASVGVVCGARAWHVLPPFHQAIGPPEFKYGGGSRIEDGALASRASELGRAAIRSLDRPTGFLGVDLVLGSDPSGRDDVVIEINPRITSSYIGASRLSRQNLAEVMWRSARGESTELSFHSGPCHFSIPR